MKKGLVLLLGAVLALLLMPSAVAKASSAEVMWKGDDVHISVLIHRYRPSSTSGWATEEFASLLHDAEFSIGHIFLYIDYSCDIEGFVTAVNGNLDVASIIHQRYGKWFRGVRASEISLTSPNFTVDFNVHTFSFKTHVDNTWTHGAWVSGEALDANIYATRLYQHFLTHGTPDEGDDDMDYECYAMISAVLSGEGDISVISDWFPDGRHSVWWGNETLAFDMSADDFNALISAENYPIMDIYMDVEHIFGEIVKPR